MVDVREPALKEENGKWKGASHVNAITEVEPEVSHGRTGALRPTGAMEAIAEWKRQCLMGGPEHAGLHCPLTIEPGRPCPSDRMGQCLGRYDWWRTVSTQEVP